MTGIVAPSGLFAIGSDPFRTSGANVACHVLNLSRAPSFEHTARASRSSLRLPRGAEVDHDATVSREPQAGNGGGQEILATRRVYSIHPTGHAYIEGSIDDGGPGNTALATASNSRMGGC